MCLAIPSKIISINGDEAEVDTGGTIYKANISLTPEAEVGDYVLLHTGYAIGIVDKEEAEETLRIFREMEALSENE